MCSSKESSLKDLQEQAARAFAKGKTALEHTENANAEIENKKKQQTKEINSSANLSPLARFLLSRCVQVNLLKLYFDFQNGKPISEISQLQ